MSEETQAAASDAIKQPAPENDTQDAAAAEETHTQNNASTQMRGSPSPPTDGKWRCEVCTYDNYPLSRKCTMCRSHKPAVGEDIFKLQDDASALPQDAGAGADADVVADRLKPLRISSPPAPAPAHSSACPAPKWPCDTCTYENWPRSAKCAMCGAPGPGFPPTAPAPARPSVGINDIRNSVCSPEAEARRSKRGQQGTVDWEWLQACLGVVEGAARPVEAYLAGGGDPARALTAAEVQLLNRASAFDAGHTLVHLAIRFHRQEILAALLARISGGGPGLKRSPSYVAPDLAAAIRHHLASCIRVKKGAFPGRYVNEFSTFALPGEIEELPTAIREQLLDEVVDREAQATLEGVGALGAWRGPRLYALWNRSCGDCLPDAACQAAYGVADRGNALRGALADTLAAAARPLYRRWAAWERAQALALHYAPDEAQLRAEWARLAAAAAAPRTPLHQLHVFVLAHVLRRPIVVYGVDLVTSFRGEPLGYAKFQGIYLPLLWEPSFCSKSPLCLGYTRGHFSALVPLEPYSPRQYICRERREEGEDATYLPLTDGEGKLLPVPFLTCEEARDAEGAARRWLACGVSRGGVLAARSARAPRPLLQAQMLEEWLNHYRRLAQQTRAPHPHHPPHTTH